MSQRHPAEQAVRAFWEARANAAAKQAAAGKADAGGTSYKDRYQILCRRLLRERLYDAACFLTTSQQSAISEPDSELTFSVFAAKIAGRTAEIQAMKATRRLQ